VAEHDGMTGLGWVAAVLGFCFFQACSWLIAYDVWRIERRQSSISHESQALAGEQPWLPVLVTGWLFSIFAALMYHLWWQRPMNE
jgi:hypothetical protein